MGLFLSLLVFIRAHPMSRAWAIDFDLIAVAIPLRRQARRTPVNRIPQSVALRSKGLANVSPAQGPNPEQLAASETLSTAIRLVSGHMAGLFSILLNSSTGIGLAWV